MRGRPGSRQHEATRRVAMLAYPDAQLLDISGPLEIFSRTARYLHDAAGGGTLDYSVEIVAKEPGPITTSSGLQVVATLGLDDVGEVDTFLLTGGIGFREAMEDKELTKWIAEQAGRSRRTASICTGAFLLARSGLLKNRRVSTHWAYCDMLAREEPSCTVEPNAIFVQDGNIHSSAGVTAGMDLALALVEEDFGSGVALAVAQELVMYLKRPGGQAQFSRHLLAQKRNDRFGELHMWLLENIARPLTVDDLAERAGMSPRNFARRFREAMGQAPGTYLLQLRLDHARHRLEEGSRNLKEIARESGFGSEQNMRRAFIGTLNVTPSEYIERFTR